VAPLVFTEPYGVGRQLAFIRKELDADAGRFPCSAVRAAGKRHLGDGDEKPAVRAIVHGANAPFADERAHETSGLDFVFERNRRRRALELARRMVLIKRLAEVAFLAADNDENITLGLEADIRRLRRVGNDA